MSATPDPERYRFGTCASSERHPALMLLCADIPAAQREAYVTQAVADAGLGLLDLTGLIVARRDGELVGCELSLPSPSGTYFVWPPRLVPELAGSERDHVGQRLVELAVAFSRRRGARMAQMLLPGDQAEVQPWLRAAGFRRLTTIIGMRRPSPDHAPESGHVRREGQWGLADYELLPFDDRTEAEFREVLQRSYRGSLDCPELDGVRSIDEILAGHQAQGEFDPANWFLVREAERPLAVLLLAGHVERSSLEIAYLGVVPEARGRGLGRELTQLAFEVARQRGVGSVQLAVDERNHPALRAYEAEGFTVEERRDAWLTFLHRADGKASQT